MNLNTLLFRPETFLFQEASGYVYESVSHPTFYSLNADLNPILHGLFD